MYVYVKYALENTMSSTSTCSTGTFRICFYIYIIIIQISGTAAKLSAKTAYHHCTLIYSVNVAELHDLLTPSLVSSHLVYLYHVYIHHRICRYSGSCILRPEKYGTKLKMAMKYIDTFIHILQI